MSVYASPDPRVPEPLVAVTGVPNGAPPVLVFDSSTEWLALAVNGPAGAFSLTVAGGAAASAGLLPQALRLVAHAGVTLTDLHAVGFGSGPGAFTGLRTACAVAQGLGLGLGLPLLPVDSLLLVAEDARLQSAERTASAGSLEVAVVMDARMNEVYAGRYLWQGASPDQGKDADQVPGQPGGQHAGAWQTLQAPQLCTLPALLQAWGDRPLAVLAGSALNAFSDQLAPLQVNQHVPAERDRAAALLHLALRALAAGQGVDAAQALPLYVRDKVAQTTLERDQARSGAAPAAAVQAGMHQPAAGLAGAA